MNCKHCGEPIKQGLQGWEHADGFIVCIEDPYHPDRETVAEPKED